MTTQKTLATFRCDPELWDAFQQKAQSEEISATKKLIQLVSGYLGIESASSPPSDLVQRLERLEALMSLPSTPPSTLERDGWFKGDFAWQEACNRGYGRSRASFYRQLSNPDRYTFFGLEADFKRRERGLTWLRFTGGPVFVRVLRVV